MHNREEDKKMLSTITYMLKCLTLSVNHIGLTLSMTVLASLIISVADQPLQVFWVQTSSSYGAKQKYY